MQLKIATTDTQLTKIHQLYEEAFPASEKKPFEFILQKRGTGSFELLEIVDEEENFCGLAIMMLYKELALLDYFAIAPECRGKGVGGKALKALQEMYAAGKFMLEIESTVGLGAEFPEEEKVLRLRRKAFYLQNGMRPMDFMVDLFGVEMEILVYGESVTFEEYYSVLQSTVPSHLIQHVRLL